MTEEGASSVSPKSSLQAPAAGRTVGIASMSSVMMYLTGTYATETDRAEDDDDGSESEVSELSALDPDAPGKLKRKKKLVGSSKFRTIRSENADDGRVDDDETGIGWLFRFLVCDCCAGDRELL
eukprot:GEMP01023999.1.p2 GENE.GEMP01023999.1~~GEMP01023999.1.p2  ORF type:complete len:124 (+),score=31.70 GEMP01023999.1:190-561(+)